MTKTATDGRAQTNCNAKHILGNLCVCCLCSVWYHCAGLMWRETRGKYILISPVWKALDCGDTYCHKISCRWWSQRFVGDPDPPSPRRSPADHEITRTVRGYSGLSAPPQSLDPAQIETVSLRLSCYMWGQQTDKYKTIFHCKQMPFQYQKRNCH